VFNMPIMYEFSKYAIDCSVDSKNINPIDKYPYGCETEHADSCDINKMVRNAANGIPVRGSSSSLIYGEDDLTMDALTHRIKKQQVEAELSELAKIELEEDVFDKIPANIKKKFGFKKRSKKQSKNNDDDKTTTTVPPKTPQTPQTPNP